MNLITPLQPHQKEVVKLIKKKGPGLLLHHAMGSGKTLSSIAAADSLNEPVKVILPASLIPNYKKELAKHLLDPSSFKLYSMQDLSRHPSKLRSGGTLVIDEAHNIRNEEASLYKTLLRRNFGKKILLTGTPIYNTPQDMTNLLKLIGPGYIYHKYDPKDKSEYPSFKEKIVSIPVNPKQKAAFRFFNEKSQENLNRLINKIPDQYFRINKKLDTNDYFRNKTRQLANTLQTYFLSRDTPKIKKIVNDIKNRPGKTLVYSNFLDSGINLIANRLKKLGIPFEEFTGKVPKKEKQKIVEKYNTDKLPVLLVSSSGTEGLDLKGTRQVIITEPHWNEQKIKQLVGRAIRYRSHAHLPEEKRKVLVKKYIDVGTTPTSDEILYDISNKKNRIAQEYLKNHF